MNQKIRTCSEQDIGILVEMIRHSFRDVAERFGLAPETAPRHVIIGIIAEQTELKNWYKQIGFVEG